MVNKYIFFLHCTKCVILYDCDLSEPRFSGSRKENPPQLCFKIHKQRWRTSEICLPALQGLYSYSDFFILISLN